jgi:hypothetical protein
VKIEIKFVKQDCWIGLYWKSLTTCRFSRPDLGETGPSMYQKRTKVYICLIPCFPIIFETRGEWATLEKHYPIPEPPRLRVSA